MTIEEYEKAENLVRMIKACDVILKSFDNNVDLEFEVRSMHDGILVDYLTLKDSGAQMLYNAINYTKNTLVKELEDI